MTENENARWLRSLRIQRRLRYLFVSFAIGLSLLTAALFFSLYRVAREISVALDQQAKDMASLTTTLGDLDLGPPGLTLDYERSRDEVDKRLAEAIWTRYGAELAKTLGVDIEELSPIHQGAVVVRRLGGEFADSFVGELGSQAAKKILSIKEAEPSASGDVLLSVSLSGGSGTLPVWVVYFDLNQAVIPVSGEAAILGAAQRAQTFSRSLVVFGSTDTTGQEAHNEELAQQRIDAVREFLTNRKLGGIPLLGVPLHGVNRPIGTLDQVSEPRNRCVYIMVV